MKSFSIVFTCDNYAGFQDRTYGAHLFTELEAVDFANRLLANPNHFKISIIPWRIKEIFSHSII